MRKYKSILKKDKKLVQIACDWCGKKSGKDGFFEGGSGEISFGYGSKFDGANCKIDICDDCFEKYADKMAIRKMQKIDAEITAGKRKLMTSAEVLKLHPELKKW